MDFPDPLPRFLQIYPRLHTKRSTHLHLVLRRRREPREAASALQRHGWRLVTMFATDERLDEDCRMKIYYIFAPGKKEDFLLILEHHLPARPRPPKHLPSFSPTLRFFASIRDIYPAVQPFENAVADMYGLLPELEDPAQVQRLLSDAHFLHDSFSQLTAPMRRTRPLSRVKREQRVEPFKAPAPVAPPPEGMSYLPVGPIHAGIIEPGRFLFLQGGEPIEQLPIRLGYKHRGIEKYFETHYRLQDGWRLAERVSGDAAFSHGLAYCLAVESLSDIQVPKAAQLWRAVLLELERIANHIHDVSGLMHDISLHIVGSQIAQQWESLLQMHQRLFGHRLLSGLVRPGGIVLPAHRWESPHREASLASLKATLEEVVGLFLSLAQRVVIDASVQDRMVDTGVLSRKEVEIWGATGFIARASGLVNDDVRIRHPQGVYASSRIQDILAHTFAADFPPSSHERLMPLARTEMQGDVYARFLLRLAEVETAFYLIDAFLQELHDLPLDERGTRMVEHAPQRIRETPTFDAGLGYVESWRGGVYYWVMKGPQNTIARCKITGPSILNWFVFPRAVARKADAPDRFNILADFPLINKSFNLSYAERDL